MISRLLATASFTPIFLRQRDLRFSADIIYHCKLYYIFLIKVETCFIVVAFIDNLSIFRSELVKDSFTAIFLRQGDPRFSGDIIYHCINYIIILGLTLTAALL